MTKPIATIKATDATFMVCDGCNNMAHGEPVCDPCLHNQALITALKEALADVKPLTTAGLTPGTALYKAIEDVLNDGLGMLYVDPQAIIKPLNDPSTCLYRENCTPYISGACKKLTNAICYEKEIKK